MIDTGAGIAYEDQDKLFKLFGFVEKTSSLNKNGVGLGLHISEQIVTKFNGKIHFVSVPDEGSTFTFTFKLTPKKPSNSQLIQVDQPTKYALNSDNLVFEWQPSQSSVIKRIKYVNNLHFSNV